MLPLNRSLSTQRMVLYAGVCVVSGGVLLLEIALTRIFSFTIWYHFAYVTISVALLGFGGAGSLLAAFPVLLDRHPFRMMAVSALAAGFAVVLALVVFARVPLDPMQVTTDGHQLAILLLYYLVVTLPFLFAGLCIAGALALAADRVARLYFWDLLGAGLGCGLAVPVIWRIGAPGAALAAAAALGVGGTLFSICWEGSRRGTTPVAAACLILLAVVAGPRLEFQPSSGKYLAAFLAMPGASHEFSRWTPINRVDFVRLETRESIHASEGAAADYDGPRLEFGMLAHDGEGCSPVYRFSGDPAELEMFRHHVLRAPYLLLDRPEVLVIGMGGGADLLNGIANGARSIVGVEINPVSVELGRTLLAEFNGGLFNRDDVTVVGAEGRHFLRSSNRRYDLIEINSVDSFSALTTGAYVLSEGYLYTSDAVGDYLDHLEPEGLFAMGLWDQDAANAKRRHTVRMASVLVEALTARGVDEPWRHVIVVAAEGAHEFSHTLVRNEPFTADEVATIEQFAGRMGFRLWHRPDRRVEGSLVSLVLWGPEARREEVYRTSPVNLHATTDESPFFFNFAKWGALFGYVRGETDVAVETSQKVLLLMLVQAVGLAVLLVVAPLLRLRVGIARVAGVTYYLTYFLALGLGFIFIEISFIQRFSLFLGYPTYSLTVIMFSLLSFTGIGSLTSAWIEDVERSLPRLLAGLILVSLCYLIALPWVFTNLLGASLAVRVAVTVALMAPVGLLMGCFFPLGIRTVRDIHPALVPWGWAANGCATVVGTIVAVILAIGWSFRVVTVAALLIYAVGVVALLHVQRVRSPV